MHIRYTFVFLFLLCSFNLKLSGAPSWEVYSSGYTVNRHDPWFWGHKKPVKVRYCLLMDEKNFGLSLAKAEKLVSQALDFWRTELREAMVVSGGNPQTDIYVGRESFVKVPCGEHDVSFQFGVLSEKQKEKLRQPTRQAAITVRTDYKVANTPYTSGRSKGFLYFSPMEGPLALNVWGYDKKAWEKNEGRLLLRVLLHELGHVFGLPVRVQETNSRSFRLMSPDHNRKVLLKQENWSHFWAHQPIDYRPLVFRQWNHSTCQDVGLAVRRGYFGMPENDRCFAIELDRNQITVFTQEKHGAPKVIIGSAKLNPKGWRSTHFPIQAVSLGMAQRPFVMTFSSALDYQSADGKLKRSLWLQIDNAGKIKLSGFYQGKIYQNIVFGDLYLEF